jgi:hypothetical protein
MPDHLNLSEAARSLLHYHISALQPGAPGTSSGEPTEETREAYRELARAGLMYPLHTFAGGPESLYRLTEQAFRRWDEVLRRIA